MARGVNQLGLGWPLKSSLSYRREPEHDVAVFYGLANGLDQIFDDFRNSGRKAVYIDLGYWGRRIRSRFDGYHKLSVNSRHPTAYFQQNKHGPERLHHHGVEVKPWRSSGDHILVAGMSAKAAGAEGWLPNVWERDTITYLRELTARPLVYRPKPNWADARPLVGSTFDRDTPLEQALVNCHAVVTHHSNVAVDALLAGVPCVCPHGVASLLSAHDPEGIEDLPTPDGREQWAADLAWTQWSVAEMESGAALRYLLDEELI